MIPYFYDKFNKKTLNDVNNIIKKSYVTKGKVTETVVLKGIPNTGLDEAAMTAIKKTKFKPAKQRDRSVGVWISIPVNFRLQG